MKDNSGIYLNFPLVSGLILLLPLNVLIIAIVLKIIGLNYPYEIVCKPIGIDNITNISLYILIANLIINFIPIVKLNLKGLSNKNEREQIYRFSFFHIGIMSLASCYTFIIYLLYGLEKLGNIPVGRG